MEAFEGLILKGVGGFYTVYALGGQTGGPAAECETVICRPRGRFRREGIKPLPGDRVSCARTSDGGRIEEIYPRKNEFFRPPVANMDALILVVSQAVPQSDPFLIDQMTALARHRCLRVVVCVNKTDIAPADSLAEIYRGAGYETLRVSARTGEGIPALRAAAAGRISAFVGNSGVGKSSLINRLRPGLSLPTAEVSLRGGRGRHTTRHVELIPMGEGAWIADTPGFSLFDLGQGALPDPEEIQHLFPEFSPYEGQCRFTGCLHLGDKGCAVREAVRQGAIASSRFDSYVRMVK